MRNKSLWIVAAIAMLALVLAGCGGPKEQVIKIATQSPLSGGMSAVGTDIKNGAQLAIEQLSGPLTAMGFKIELAAFDDQGNPDTGVANAKNIVSDPAILVIVGHYNSGVQIPSSEEYHAAGLANVSPANTNPKVTERGYLEVSRICGRDDVQGAVGAQFANTKGIKSAYVLHDKTAYGQGIAEYFKRESENLGIKVLGFAGTEEKANFDSILSPILASKPEAIYFGGMFDQAAVLFKQARQKGYMGMFLSDDGFDSSDAAKIGGAVLLAGRRNLLLHGRRTRRRLSGHRQVPGRLQGQVRRRAPALRRPVLRQRGHRPQGHRERRHRRRKEDPRPRRRGQGRPRPQGLPRHHRNLHLQRQGRPCQGQVLHHPGDVRRSGQVVAATRSTRSWTSHPRSDSNLNQTFPAPGQPGAGNIMEALCGA